MDAKLDEKKTSKGNDLCPICQEKPGRRFENKFIKIGNLCRGEMMLACSGCQSERDKKMDIEKTEKEKESLLKSYLNIGIKKRMFYEDLASYIAVLPGQKRAFLVTKKFIETIPDRLSQGDCLVFCGTPGSGKTHLGIAIIKAVMRLGRISTRYITVPEIIRKVRSTYKNYGGTVEQLVNDLSVIDILVIDEVGVDAGKEDTTILFDVIDTRYRNQLPTVIISNLNKELLTDYVGVRTMDRLEEGLGIVVAFDWPSYRQKKGGN
jgi:DNA replication protein DnaC